MRSSDKSSPASSRAAKATPRPTCSGIGDFRCPTSRWATRCSKNPNGSEWGSVFALPDQEAIARHPNMRHVANARMYSVNPQAASAWKELFDWLSRESGVELDVLDHALPLPLSDLWPRADLACYFMCRFDLALATRPPRPDAGLVPSKAPAPWCPDYLARLVVHGRGVRLSRRTRFAFAGGACIVGGRIGMCRLEGPAVSRRLRCSRHRGLRPDDALGRRGSCGRIRSAYLIAALIACSGLYPVRSC